MKEVLIFGHDGCSPCKVAKKELEKRIPIKYIDCMENQKAAVRFNVQHTPTIVLIDGNRELERWAAWSPKIGDGVVAMYAGG